MEELQFKHPDILKARNPFGLFSEFDEKRVLYRAKADLESLDVKDLEPSEDIDTQFREIRRLALQPEGREMITNVMSWKDKPLGTISYYNHKDANSPDTLMNKPIVMGLNGERYDIEPQEEVFIVKGGRFHENAVKITLVKDGDPILLPVVPNLESWRDFVDFLHEAGHYLHLLRSTQEEILLFGQSNARFDGMREVHLDNATQRNIELERLFSRSNMVETLRQEHAANQFAFAELERIKKAVNLPDDLYLNILKRLVRNYRTYCAWVNIVLANY